MPETLELTAGTGGMLVTQPAPARASPVVAMPDYLPFYDFFCTFVRLNAISLTIYPCHEEICHLYQDAVLGKLVGYEYIVVNMARRLGKTKILQALACWMLGEFGDAQMIYGCYSERLVMRTIAYAGATMTKRWYRELYGNNLLTQRADLITTRQEGALYGSGTSATTAGFGAGLKTPAGGFIALDDPANPVGSLSPVARENTIENFETTWKGCRNSDQYCPIIVNAQRIAGDDLPGYLEANYRNKTYTLKFPCMVGGVSVFPDTWKTETLKDLEKTRFGRYVLASQFMQEPVALGGNLIPVDCFDRWDPAEWRSYKFDRLVITVDTALKTKEANDFSALALWGRLEKKAYLIDLMHGKWESPELLANTTAFWEKWKDVSPRARIIIEEKAAGTPLLQNLVKNGVPARGIERDIDKVRRVQNVLPFIETHMVVVPRIGTTPWIGKWEAEHAAFSPNGTHSHDDMVDTTADGIDFLLARKLSSFDVLFDKK